MARLIARYELTIDGKGRLVLPAVHRSRYADGAVCSPRGDHLAIYEPSEWDRFVGELEDARRSGGIDREAFNWLTMNTIDPVPDQAGRILLPQWLRDEVGLERDVIVAGHGDYLGVHRGDYIRSVSPAVRSAAAESLNRLGL
jgi:DNA-binding transcriptional regulator/RsmH inhibitor MraZ